MFEKINSKEARVTKAEGIKAENKRNEPRERWRLGGWGLIHPKDLGV